MVTVELCATAIAGKFESVLAITIDANEGVLAEFFVDELCSVVFGTNQILFLIVHYIINLVVKSILKWLVITIISIHDKINNNSKLDYSSNTKTIPFCYHADHFLSSNSCDDRGKKRSLFPSDFAINCRISRYLICIAALEFRISADSFINLAASTSACAEMILLSASLLVLAVIDRSVWSSRLITISLM